MCACVGGCTVDALILRPSNSASKFNFFKSIISNYGSLPSFSEDSLIIASATMVFVAYLLA